MKTKYFSKFVIVMLVLVLAVGSYGCTSQPPKSTETSVTTAPTEKTEAPVSEAQEPVKTVKIGVLINITGDAADSGKQGRQGMELLVERINKEGGIKSLGGAQVELVIGDTMSDANKCKSVAERLLSDPDIVAVIGSSGSTYTIPVLPTFEKAQVPYIVLNVGDVIHQQGYKYIFQNNCLGSQFGQTQVDFFKYINEKYDFGLTKIGLVYENSEYGISTTKANRDIAEAGGFEVVLEQSFPVGMSDASSLVLQLKESGAQAIFPVAFSKDAKLLFNTMSSMNYHPMVIGGGAGFLMPAMAEELGEDVVGLVSVAQMNWDSNSITNNLDFPGLAEEYESKYNEFMTEHSLLFLSALQTTVAAIELAGSTDHDAVRDALAVLETPNIQPNGTVKFNEEQWNSNARPVMVQWQKDPDGVYRPRTVYPESEAPVEYLIPGTK